MRFEVLNSAYSEHFRFWKKCTDVSEEPNIVIFRVVNFATLFFMDLVDLLAIYVVMSCILETRPSHIRTLLFLPSSPRHLAELACFLYNRSVGF